MYTGIYMDLYLCLHVSTYRHAHEQLNFFKLTMSGSRETEAFLKTRSVSVVVAFQGSQSRRASIEERRRCGTRLRGSRDSREGSWPEIQNQLRSIFRHHAWMKLRFQASCFDLRGSAELDLRKLSV